MVILSNTKGDGEDKTKIVGDVSDDGDCVIYRAIDDHIFDRRSDVVFGENVLFSRRVVKIGVDGGTSTS
jgi:hypothetical protein